MLKCYKKCRLIIHAATASGSVHAVSQAVSKSLEICRKNGISSVAFPALGTGTGGLDIRECARMIIGEVVSFFKRKEKAVKPDLVIVVLYPRFRTQNRKANDVKQLSTLIL